jgi:hypothetical protein
MATDEAALVLVLPDDDIASLIQKVRNAGTSGVEMLVPDASRVLHDPAHCAELQSAAQEHEIWLLVISSDAQTLQTARASGLETVGVEGTHIQAPTNGGAPAPAPTAAAPAAASADDDDFFSDLDNLSDIMNASDSGQDAEQISSRERRPATADDDFASDLDDLSASFDSDDDFASDLDDLSAAFDDDKAAPRPAAPAAPAAPQQRPRIRPEDIELSDDEKERAGRVRGASTTRERLQPKRDKRARPAETHAAEPAEPRPAPRRSFPLTWVLVAVVLILIILAGLFVFRDSLGGFIPGLSNRATIDVQLPTQPDEPIQISDLPIAITSIGTNGSEIAVQADPIWTTVSYTVTGQVNEETSAPTSSARGLVTLYNQSTQEFSFPQGTEFVGLNPSGNEVIFTTDGPVTLTPATTSRQGAQIVTTLGSEQVTVTARAPGSGGNIEANTISQIRAPGQAPITVNTDAILLEHGPITGGSEDLIRIVKDTDVNEALGPALTGLNNRARQALETELARRDREMALEVTTITPDADTLARGEGYTMSVLPPIGQPVDGENAGFFLTVEGQFSALATPPGNSLEQQLRLVLPSQLEQEGQLPPGMTPALRPEDWHWNGSALTVDGELQPTGEQMTLNEQQRREISNAIAGKPRAEAEAILNDFVRRGIISSYTIPSDLETLPDTLVIRVVSNQQ